MVQEEPGDLEYPLNHIRTLNQVNPKSGQPYLVDLQLDGKPLAMEVDTGACMLLISEQTFKQLYPMKT